MTAASTSEPAASLAHTLPAVHTSSVLPEEHLCGILLDGTRGPLTPEWEVVRATAQGRVLHFNGASCYIKNIDGTLMITETAQAPSTMRMYPAGDEWAASYLRQNPAKQASVSEALRLGRTFGLL